MKHAVDIQDIVTITIKSEDGHIILENSRGMKFMASIMTPDTLILAMLYQTLQTRLKALENISDTFKIELQIHEVID